MDFSAYQEPRGVMRVLHFVFAICTFITVLEYRGEVNFHVDSEQASYKYPYKYPFDLSYEKNLPNNCTVSINGYYASDTTFFVIVGVFAMLAALGVMILYVRAKKPYRSNKNYTIADFCITVIFAVLWLSGSAAWANSLTGIKSVLLSPIMSQKNCCTFQVSSFSSLNISVVLGFLNFFLWTADLWFVYKETSWFQQSSGLPEPISGV